MKLKDFFEYYRPLGVEGNPDLDITGFSVDSRQVREGNLFFAFSGSHTDGILHLNKAVEKGAAAVVFGKKTILPGRTGKSGFVSIQVEDAEAALSRWSSAFYGFPSKRMDIAGVTGTNGKTTVSWLIYELLKKGADAGLVGTLGYKFGDTKGSFSMTTPRPHELHGLFACMLEAGIEKAVMEVSSHGLKMKRVMDVEFGSAIFTNLTRDHLDFHKTFEDYFNAKMLLFGLLRKPRKALVNIDDEYGSRIPGLLDFKPVTYGIKNQADYMAEPGAMDLSGTSFTLTGPGGFKKDVKVNLVGRFNIYNCLAAMAWAIEKGGDMEAVCKVVSEASPVPGRLEIISKDEGDDRVVVIDYAHTPVALENVLSTLRPVTSGRLICLFGCGGDRDRDKRPLMGEIAGRLADVVYVTSDNPRYEDPLSIVLDIELGVRKTGVDYFVIPDRHECMREAISTLQSGDCILVAGKGDEEYQIIGDEKFPFSDRCVARSFL